MIPTVRSDRVSAVLLDDGVWREVANESFSVDVLEARGGALVWHSTACGPACTAGFAFATADGSILAGPLGRIRDVRA